MIVNILNPLLLAGLSNAALAPYLNKRACGETVALTCFGSSGSTSQNVNTDDVAYAATYLRSIAKETAGTPEAFWTMPPSTDCEEWQLPLSFGETVMSLAKHINPRTNSSVLFEDLANTIDGGENPTAAQLAASLLGACGTKGGMRGVMVNASNPAYSTPGYIAGKGKPTNIIVKIVHAPV